jgi:IMP and pyridine-specific 5'-nucleotidase
MITVLSPSAFSWVPLMLYLVAHQKVGLHRQSKLKLLVPTIGTFFTRLPLADAFRYQDSKRFISSRRFVPPSFNDIRLILNTAQLMGLTAAGPVDLATFDGDVTLYANQKDSQFSKYQVTLSSSYDDGESLERTNPVIPKIISTHLEK